MDDSFQCKKCGATYSRERRRIGKAVICKCGHKFLVPPSDAPEPVQSTPTQHRGGQSVQGGPLYVASGDSSSEAIPVAEPIAKGTGQPAGSWAEPIEPEARLPEAEVVYESSATPLGRDNAFSAAGPREDHLSVPARYTGPLSPPPLRPRSTKKRSKKANETSAKNVTEWIANAVFYALLPMSGLFVFLGIVQFCRVGSLVSQAGMQEQAERRDPRAIGRQYSENNQKMFDDYVRQRKARRDANRQRGQAAMPVASGNSLNVVRVTKSALGDEFTLEYQLAGTVNHASQYYWVVSCPQGRIEFPIPGMTWQSSGTLSGKPSAAGNLSPPYSSYIEEQTGATRTRVSNEVAVTVGGI